MQTRILPGRRVFVDFGGQVPNNKVENGRVSGRTQDEYNQVTPLGLSVSLRPKSNEAALNGRLRYVIQPLY